MKLDRKFRDDGMKKSLHYVHTPGLAAINQWMEDASPDASPVFWLTGPGGSGKSTIALQISNHYEAKSDVLLADFFFSFQFETADYIIPSIAIQLARLSRSFHSTLILNDPFEPPEAPDKQLKKFLVEPRMKCTRGERILIIIDALDELPTDGGHTFLRQLLDVIHNGQLPGFRFLFTSRPEQHIKELFKECLLDGVTYSLS